MRTHHNLLGEPRGVAAYRYIRGIHARTLLFSRAIANRDRVFEAGDELTADEIDLRGTSLRQLRSLYVKTYANPMREPGGHCEQNRISGFGSLDSYVLVSGDDQAYICKSNPDVSLNGAASTAHFDQLSKLVSIHLSPALDADLRGGKRTVGRSKQASRAFHKLLATYGLKPKPLFSDNRNPEAESIWHAAIPDNETAEIVEKLLATPGVTAAYIKPDEEPPGSP